MHTALSLITAYFCIILVTFSNFNLVLAQYRYNPDRGRSPVRDSHHRTNYQTPTRGDQVWTDLDALHPLVGTRAARLHAYAARRGSVPRYQPQRLHPCDQSSCYPATGNLLIGREKQLSASSTCGMRDRERYCIVSHLEERKCFWCHSTVPNKPHLSHQISNIVYEYLPGTRQRSWWQSENGKENVTIQLDLEAEFHFTHLIIVFRTFRPAAMLIERSYDFGRTWQVYRYFAQKCEESFPGVPSHTQRHLSDVVCESRYSNVAPSTNGEVIFRVLPPALTIDNPYSQDVQNLLKMTNLRINFTKLHTLGDDLLDNRQEIREKYYYAIHSMVVRGSCSCYGHANRCLPSAGIDPKPDMVHSNCDCTHHTKGRNCEQCEDFFNDLPWKPAIGKQTNACKQCNCNNHANSCHFDAAVYEQSGKVSGGVCDGCRHNTMGTNCEMCKPFYYHDPTKNIQDPEACRPCDCDPSGSLDEGVCDSRTDMFDSQEAGSCHCKTNVQGRRCDSCKNGFWNFTEKNPDGCEQCTCNTLGTIGNQGCNVLTGECTCKRYVTGRDCNQCLPEYWGLSEKRDGCEECDCNKGGSLDNSCDVVTGQCRCRENIQGRKCDKPKQSYYIPALDFYVYEAEVAKVSDNCQIIIREPYRDGRQSSWTGTGFAKAFENSQINFTVDNIKKDMSFDTLIRYEPQVLGDWVDVFITVERLDGPVNPNGPCANWRPEDDRKHVILRENNRYAVSSTPTCFEAGKTYNVIIEFKRKNPSVASPGASILVDSILLIPRGDSVPFMREDEIANMEYDRNRCGEYFYPLHRGDVPEPCKKYFESLSYYVFDSAFPCQCNITGSISKLCSSYGGNCQCKSNVVGRKCDRCAPGTYGFGPEGCKPCDCDGIGSLDNFCDVVTGQCKCRPNTYGRECNQCQPGYWNFPNCQQCQCHGHADICDPKTGACTTCRDYTTGHYCEQCIDGYYGDPRLGEDIPCRPCPCPETISSGHSFADRCTLDSKTKDVICECLEGYAGTRCDVCADNYYGHPETSGGSCQVCDCSSNVDVTRPGNCDPHSGQCLQCLYNTEGDHCEHCKIGYYGNALEQSCTECVCDILGSKNNSIVNHCDRVTGQCPCHKNVVGLKCDECLENHWKIASGNGCEPCNCDSVGSNSKQCNYFDGQCDCKQGFGGLQCNQCETNYWGDPNVECHPCDCDPDGSITQQCHRNNGSCICHVGIGGEKCDVCAHGFLGTAPSCSHCGECFNNWNDILIQRQAQTMAVIDKARNIKKIGATGAYTKEFDEMEHQLDEVRDLLNNSKISTGDLDEINNTLSDLFDKQKQVESYAISVDAKRSNVSTEILISNVSLDKLQKQSEELKNRATELKNKATDLQEANVDEALRITLNARNVVRGAEDRALDSKDIVEEADRQCRAAESIVARTKNDSKFEWNDEQLDMLQDELNGLKSNISLLNEHMCARRGDPCDSLCGGAGCGTCGGVSCEEGAVEKVKKALTLTQEASAEIKNKEAKAEELLRTLSQAHLKTKEAHDEAQKTFDKALSINNTVGDQLIKTQSTIKKLQESLNSSYGKPEDVQKLAKDTLDKKILLDPAEITDLAQRINQTVTSLTDIDKILKATAADLNRANNLENRAIQTRDDAKKILDTTSNVTAALTEADSAQLKAEEAIGKANDDIAKAEKDLKEIASETKEAQVKANDTVTYVNEYRNRLRILQTNFLKNERGAKEIDRKASNVLKDAEKARSDAEYLQTKYSQTNSSLSEKAEKSLGIRDRAQGLLLKASKLTVNLTDKLNFLSGLSNESNNQEQKLKELAQIIEELNASMDNYLLNIRDRSAFYRSCT